MQNHFLYIRFSHDKQAEGTSYERQLGNARSFCPTLIEDKEHIYFDSGKSAFHGKQLESGGELRRFYDDVKSGKVPRGSVLLVEDLDRLSRDGMWKASDKLRELTENGIGVRTLRDGKLYQGTLTFSDGVMALLKQEVANEESKKKSSRVADSYVIRKAKARTGKKVKVLLPSWLEWVAEDKPYKVKEEQAAVVVDIFSQAAAGYSYAIICKNLNGRGIKPFRNKKNPDALWIPASLFAMVKNEAVLGTYAPRDGGPPIPLYFPPIMDQAMFDAAQGARVDRRRDGIKNTAARVNLWQKVGVCGLCGRPMHCVPKGRNKGNLYLLCSGKMGGMCNAINIEAKRAEEVFKEVLVNVVNAEHFTGDDRKQDEMERRQLEGQIDAVQQRRDKLVAMLDVDPTPEVATAIKKAKAEIAALAEAKAAIEERSFTEVSIERSKAALMAKIDLVNTDARMDANGLLRRLKIRAELVRIDDQISYVVRQDGKRILSVYDRGTELVTLPSSQETAERMHDQGELPELEYSVSLSDVVRSPMK